MSTFTWLIDSKSALIYRCLIKPWFQLLTLGVIMELNETAISVLKQRYLLKDENGKIVEKPEDMIERVAKFASSKEKEKDKWYKEFKKIMIEQLFLPNSPTLFNAGTKHPMLFACFVIDVPDSIEGIFDAVKTTAKIQKMGGGTGFNFSKLRPEGDIVKTTMGSASGPVSFIEVFDVTSDVIKQGGKRRGANMGILNVSHPDIEKFLECKKEEGKLSNFNISVGIDRSFIDAVKEGKEYPLINPRNGELVKTVNAKTIWKKIAEGAWRNGEPGIIYLDNINRLNPTIKSLGPITATNPCGEQPLYPGESCCLGSINLSRFVKNGGVDWKGLERVTKIATRFLDNLIDLNMFPETFIEERTKLLRRIGLGIMGLADVFLLLGIRYGSRESVLLAKKLMESVEYWAKEESINLARERGPFPHFSESLYREGFLPIDASNEKSEKIKDELKELTGIDSPSFSWDKMREKVKEGVRNVTCTTVAPTGSISIIAGTSSGIEPIFAFFYKRKITAGEFVEIHPGLLRLIREKGLPEERIIREVEEGKSVKEIPDIPDSIKPTLVTTYDISPDEHVEILSAVQEFTENAVSKTINVPNSFTVEETENIFLKAYTMGIKGITFYRDGSRKEQVLKKLERKEGEVLRPTKRPTLLRGITYKEKTGCGNIYVTVNMDDGKPQEVFLHIAKSGGCVAAFSEALGRVTSAALRAGVDGWSLVKQLEYIRCPRPVIGGAVSCPDAVARAIRGVLEEAGRESSKREESASLSFVFEKGIRPECPMCGGEMAFEEGCAKCLSCGYSECD